MQLGFTDENCFLALGRLWLEIATGSATQHIVLGPFTWWWLEQFCWRAQVNSRTLPYLRPVLDSSQWDGSSGVVYQSNWKKLRAISVTYFPNQSILCYILLCPPTPVMLCFWYTTDMDCPHQALSVSDKNNKFDQLLAWAMPFLKGT